MIGQPSNPCPPALGNTPAPSSNTRLLCTFLSLSCYQDMSLSDSNMSPEAAKARDPCQALVPGHDVTEPVTLQADECLLGIPG